MTQEQATETIRALIFYGRVRNQRHLAEILGIGASAISQIKRHGVGGKTETRLADLLAKAKQSVAAFEAATQKIAVVPVPKLNRSFVAMIEAEPVERRLIGNRINQDRAEPNGTKRIRVMVGRAATAAERAAFLRRIHGHGTGYYDARRAAE